MAKDPNETLDSLLGPVRSGAEAPSVFAGRYEVQRQLGEGGQKQVFLARDTLLDRDVVIALLKTERLDANSAGRLRREAQAMARLGDHPHIVTVFDIGEEGGRPFIVSQYVSGGSVADLLKKSEQHRLAIPEALRVAEQLCQALAYAHARGIVHRDLKPANVWLTEDGKAKLGDFGLAIGPNFSDVYLEGSLVGTVAYVAPEAAMGRLAEPRSDLYSLGILLYELVTGRTPFQGDLVVSIISQHMHTPPVAPSWHNPGVPAALEAVILQLLAKDPAGRPQTAAEVAQALAQIASTAAMDERVVPQDTTSIARLSGGVFVGREQQVKKLRLMLHDARSGRGRFVLLSGEAGAGKSTLAEQLATYARLLDIDVFVGRCYEGEGAPAFWPWVQVIRSWVQAHPNELLESAMGVGAADIAQIVGEVQQRLPALPPPPALEPQQARFRLFDSVTAFLRNAAKPKPMLLVLEDLHWADRPSLLLLEFLARELRDARLLVVATCRDGEADTQQPISQSLPELARLGERIPLPGLAETDVARFIEIAAGLTPSEKLVSSVHQNTEGNPFFVTEVVRLLVAEGRLDRPRQTYRSAIQIPETVREVIGRRLKHLSSACQRILTIASVIGREFSLEVLEALGEFSADELVDALDSGARSRIIGEAAGASGSYIFTHALIRETLYGSLSTPRRIQLHARIAEVLETLYSGDPESHAAELAYHFVAAERSGNAEKAMRYSEMAGRRASSALAYEQATAHFERALQVLERRKRPEEERRCELLLELGEAQAKGGMTESARQTYQQAAASARARRAGEQLARAALGMATGVMGVRFDKVDEPQIALLHEALECLREQESGLVVRLMAQLALASYHAEGERLRLSQHAVEVARRVDDPGALLAALFSRSIALEGFPRCEERLAVATELVEIGAQTGHREVTLRGHYRRFRELLELGEFARAVQAIEDYTRLAEELRQPVYLWLVPYGRASLALREGRFEECEELTKQALAIGQRAQDPTAYIYFMTMMVTLRRLQGRAIEIESDLRAIIEKYRAPYGWRAALCQILCELDRETEARSEFESLASGSFSTLPRDGAYATTIALLAQISAVLNDRARAAQLYDLLLPFARYHIIIGTAAAFYGPVSRHLGLLATTLGRWDDAIRHFESALEMTSSGRSRPFQAYCQFDYAAMLVARAIPEDADEASQLLVAAAATAAELSMRNLAERVQRLRLRHLVPGQQSGRLI